MKVIKHIIGTVIMAVSALVLLTAITVGFVVFLLVITALFIATFVPTEKKDDGTDVVYGSSRLNQFLVKIITEINVISNRL